MWPAVVTTHPILADLFLPASKKADLKSPTIVISLLSTAFLNFRKHSRGSKELILSIQVHYELLKNFTYKRRTEIFYHKQNKPAVKKVEEELDWDKIPGNVRSSYLIEGQKISTFKLYPIE